MGDCLKGKSDVKKKEAKFRCGKCEALTGKKGHVCKPVRIDEKKGKKKKAGK